MTRGGLFLLFGLILAMLLPGSRGATAPAEIQIVRDGQAMASIVLPDQPTPVARYAAQELVYHVAKATGATLRVLPEAEASGPGPLVYVGPCRAAKESGIDVTRLPAEAFVLKSAGNHLFIAGNDSSGDPLDPDTRAGTVFGVYEWLEVNLKVRWLWPGELGTYVPRTRTLTAGKMDRTSTPRLLQRRVRAGLSFASQNPALGFTP